MTTGAAEPSWSDVVLVAAARVARARGYPATVLLPRHPGLSARALDAARRAGIGAAIETGHASVVVRFGAGRVVRVRLGHRDRCARRGAAPRPSGVHPRRPAGCEGTADPIPGPPGRGPPQVPACDVPERLLRRMGQGVRAES